MSLNEVKKGYNRLAVLAKRSKDAQREFDDLCREYYGFVFNDCHFSIDPNKPSLTFADTDSIIDTLDYGTDCLPFEEFDKMMQKAKNMRIAAELREVRTSNQVSDFRYKGAREHGKK